jgi:hypothetical protein
VKPTEHARDLDRLGRVDAQYRHRRHTLPDPWCGRLSLKYRAARVIDAVGGAAPNVVELELARAVPLAAFDQAFGAGEPSVQLHLGDPVEWAYSSKALAQQHVTCAIFARVADDGVRFVTVRRDRHQ